MGASLFALEKMEGTEEVEIAMSIPIRAKIVATMIEPGKTAALFSTDGELQVCRAGETIEEAQAKVISIDAEKVVLKYANERVTLDLPKALPSKTR